MKSRAGFPVFNHLHLVYYGVANGALGVAERHEQTTRNDHLF